MFYSVIERTSKLLRGNPLLKSLAYDPVKRVMRRRLASFDYILYYLQHNAECREIVQTSDDNANLNFGQPVGILADPHYFHYPYIAACKKLGVPYKVVDLFAADWMEQVKMSGCDLFLTWPGESIKEWKRLYDDRLRMMVDDFGKRIYPDLKATWLYGSKERQGSWLDLNGFPHPRTWFFYLREEAERFVQDYLTSDRPLVAKTDLGAIASGVTILRSKQEALRYIRRAFSSGTPGYYADRLANQWRHLLFQEYLPNAKEWRVHRLGDKFFGFGKLKRGEFHSGSGETNWVVPPIAALDLARAITEEGRFRSMAVDIFETEDGQFLVNELQCVYGQHSEVQLINNGTPGCMVHEGESWRFESNVKAELHGCVLRVQDALVIMSMAKNGIA